MRLVEQAKVGNEGEGLWYFEWVNIMKILIESCGLLRGCHVPDSRIFFIFVNLMVGYRADIFLERGRSRRSCLWKTF